MSDFVDRRHRRQRVLIGILTGALCGASSLFEAPAVHGQQVSGRQAALLEHEQTARRLREEISCLELEASRPGRVPPEPVAPSALPEGSLPPALRQAREDEQRSFALRKKRADLEKEQERIFYLRGATGYDTLRECLERQRDYDENPAAASHGATAQAGRAAIEIDVGGTVLGTGLFSSVIGGVLLGLCFGAHACGPVGESGAALLTIGPVFAITGGALVGVGRARRSRAMQKPQIDCALYLGPTYRGRGLD